MRKALQALKDRTGDTKLTLLSDEKGSYGTLVREVFGALAAHETTPGTVPRLPQLHAAAVPLRRGGGNAREAAGLLPRALRGMEVLAWRQDWGERSVDPMSPTGGRTVAQMRSAVA